MKTVTSNKTLREAVTRELDWDARFDSDHIGVSAKDGAIVLSGHVPSYGDRWGAVKAAERVYGVRAVADEIEVTLAASSVRDDSDLAEDISRAFRSNLAIPDSVAAEVDCGHVTLRGDVEWAYQRSEAQRTLRNLQGVHKVSNVIAIKPGAPTAADVAERVNDAIERMADLDARSIWVTTDNGAVQLHGNVHSLAERRTAGLAAASAPGVADVENEIRVTP
jgi:osmotically-inducible protein OsmY